MSEMEDRKASSGAESTGMPEKHTFIKEKIEPPRRRKKWHWILGITLCAAVVFGLAASFTFVISRPWMEEHFGEHRAEVLESVSIPQDETEEETADTADAAEWAVDETALKERVDEQVEAYLSTVEAEDLVGGYDCRTSVKDAQKAIGTGLVTVTTSRDSQDLFENAYTDRNQTFGIVLTKTSKQVLVLTRSGLTADGDEIYVTLADQMSIPAKVLGEDASLGMAVIRILRDDVEKSTWKNLQEVTLGNSYRLSAGDSVIALGCPMGSMNSVNEGIISFIQDQQGVDQNYPVIQTNMDCSSSAAGILVNSDGEVVGWITQGYNKSSFSNLLAAISISSVKKNIENLSNGREEALLGIRMQVVTKNIEEAYDVPQGIYVSSCDSEGPAYQAGIQGGDVIISMDGMDTLNEMEYLNAIRSLEPESTVELVLMRQGRQGYTEMTVEVELSTR